MLHLNLRILFCYTWLFLFFMGGKAQVVDEITSRDIQICWAKTFHIIYPTDIRYFSLGDGNVVGEQADNCPNVIRLKASGRDFSGQTNLTVVTADSRFYSYTISYTADVASPFIREGETDRDSVRYTLPVTDANESHIIFPSNLIYVDYGDESVEIEKAPGVENIVSVRAREIFSEETNVSVITDDGKFYTFNLCYRKAVPVLSFIVDKDSRQMGQVAILDDREMSVMQKDSIHKEIDRMPRKLKDRRETIGEVEFSIHNVMVKDNTLFLKMQLDNRSQINYGIDFIRFYIQDQKRSKRTAEQQIELVPLFYFGYPGEVRYHEKAVFTAALEKFTIPDGKECIIEIQEMGGGRHFYYKLHNRQLLSAEVLLTETKRKEQDAQKETLPASPFHGINDSKASIWKEKKEYQEKGKHQEDKPEDRILPVYRNADIRMKQYVPVPKERTETQVNHRFNYFDYIMMEDDIHDKKKKKNRK